MQYIFILPVSLLYRPLGFVKLSLFLADQTFEILFKSIQGKLLPENKTLEGISLSSISRSVKIALSLNIESIVFYYFVKEHKVSLFLCGLNNRKYSCFFIPFIV